MNSAGKLCQLERDIPRHSGQGLLFKHTFHHQTRSSLASKCSHCSVVHLVSNLSWTTARDAAVFPGSEKFGSLNSSVRLRGMHFSVSAFSPQWRSSSSIRSRKVEKALGNNEACLQVNHVKGIHAYQSGEYSMPGPNLDSIRSENGADEVVLAQEDDEKASPWWAQLPKRWVIVLLCFTSFLLCNMDRVSLVLICF